MTEIILFGFSGAGKSTVANLVGEKYNLRIIHPSGILRDLLENKPVDINNTRYNTGFWESEKGIKLFNSRLNQAEPLDVISDRILVQEINKGNVVIDSWSLPWLTNKGIKIYLQADLEVRANRVSKRSNISYNKAFDIIKIKDKETTNLFKRLYDFNIKQDYHVFDYKINTNNKDKLEVFKNICSYLELS
ncbi:AAA family ATPase [Candidatus Woesearchaeota archaeon]|jgi:CMP/dCMP kinase|nr:AAA family ATPase [Candidatus Woesearchaeota archaeon]MBT6518511.1 AAA family ATPase [Candidatus Woesearchaeota archaeon]MBT7368664.1 AAA family ATPase [Candidatus Woesearchaeota archaeon]